jgi:hypothetical protein
MRKFKSFLGVVAKLHRSAVSRMSGRKPLKRLHGKALLWAEGNAGFIHAFMRIYGVFRLRGLAESMMSIVQSHRDVGFLGKVKR